MGRLILIAQCMMVCIAMYGQGFVHPGMLHNTGDLEYMRSKVLAGEEPWKTAWDSLKASELAQLDYQPTPYAVVANGPYNNPDVGGREFVQDGGAAYTMALQWFVSKDAAYAEKVIEIFNAWSATLDSVTNHNRQLKVGTAGIKYLNAAEIIKHTYNGWKESDRKAFEEMVLQVWYPVIADWTPKNNGNWDAANIQTMMCMGTTASVRRVDGINSMYRWDSPFWDVRLKLPGNRDLISMAFSTTGFIGGSNIRQSICRVRRYLLRSI